MKRFSLGFVAVGLAAVSLAAMAAVLPAYAADMEVAPAANPPVLYRPLVYNWTGIYFGGHVGADILSNSVTQSTTSVLQNAGSRTNITPFGLVGGGQFGINYEFAPWVVGFEGTFSSTNISGSQTASTLLIFTNGISERATSADHWYATAAGRFGYAANDLLFYAKGGAAWMRATYTQDLLTAGVVTTTQVIPDTRMGFVAGLGVEYGISENLSLKLEYDYLGFGTKNYNFTAIGGAANTLAGVAGSSLPVAIKSDVQVATVGFNYRFSWGGGGPVVPARY